MEKEKFTNNIDLNNIIPWNSKEFPVKINSIKYNQDNTLFVLATSRGYKIFSTKNMKQVEYIGQTDPTYLGSRDFLPFSTLQQIKQLVERSNENDYSKNINIFIEEMEKNNIPYFRNENSNTFIIDLPCKEFAEKYQLATFDNDTKAHVIIFPSHKEENIKSLVEDLSKYMVKPKILQKTK